MAHDLIAALTSGAISELIMMPACTIQTLYMTQKNFHNETRINIWKVTKNLYKEHGIKGFYKAAFSGVISQMVSTGSKFTIYKQIQQHRQTDNKDIFNNALNGGLAGILSIPLTQPFDVWKNYKQRQLKNLPSSPKDYYRGWFESAAKSAVLIASLFSLNDFTRSYINNSFLAATATSLLITPIIHPIELCKRRRIAKQKIWLGWNPRNYYRGLLCNMFRATPHFAISMYVIDFMKTKVLS